MNFKKQTIIVVVLGLLIFLSINTFAQELESDGYKIVNPTVNSGGGVATSTGYSIFITLGEAGISNKLDSANYSLNTGSPNPFQANVPKINCFETTSTSATTLCSYFPNANGAVGECGEPGCFDRAKIEIDDQGNPLDTLYLVALSTDSFVNEVFFLQGDHTIGTTFDINSYMTQCDLEGRDDDDPDCNNLGDPNWNPSLQSYNILGLTEGTEYEVAVRAVHGDFTETIFSADVSATTSFPSIGFDLDVSATDEESSAPYFLAFGKLSISTPTTAAEGIWIDVSSNIANGIEVRVESTSSGLYSLSNNVYINSETEDLDIDDGDGGYGGKLFSVSQSGLGPIQQGTIFNTGGTNTVGALKGIPTTVIFTDNLSTNKGQVVNGRARFNLIAKSYSGLPIGTYSDSLFFTALSR